MVNLIGDELDRMKQDPECLSLLELPKTYLHDYAKREVRPRRKMGHVTFLADDRSTAQARADQLRKRLLTFHKR
jgi:5-(carboxyamino)imidazole ribonucleotide synthase